ncbi:hypothetical protein ALC53_03735 [Atta colombica]|uniref:Uncharacterized protein n=1 Tax=Atta colombica TaxID=520822 RepID=A0A151I4X6_9HYME|nr:hypothetical protein ALC53_03735 [Atta colombica]
METHPARRIIAASANDAAAEDTAQHVGLPASEIHVAELQRHSDYPLATACDAASACRRRTRRMGDVAEAETSGALAAYATGVFRRPGERVAFRLPSTKLIRRG